MESTQTENVHQSVLIDSHEAEQSDASCYTRTRTSPTKRNYAKHYQSYPTLSEHGTSSKLSPIIKC